MNTISTEEIRQDPSTFLQRLESGEAFTVLRDNRPLAEVKPILRPYGLCAGQFSLPADFDAPLPPEVLAEFEGR